MEEIKMENNIKIDEYCIVREDTGDVVYTGDYWDCKEHLRIFLEDDHDRYFICEYSENEKENN